MRELRIGHKKKVRRKKELDCETVTLRAAGQKKNGQLDGVYFLVVV